MDSLAEILQADAVLAKADELKEWARAAREAAGSHANEHPGNGDGKPAGGMEW